MDFALTANLSLELPSRFSPDLEAHLAGKFEGLLAGIDEAGRGPWAGPVATAAVILDYRNLPKGLNDSKQLSELRREELFEEICASADVAIAFASPKRIDRMNIRAATLWAMRRAALQLRVQPAACLVDGRDVPPAFDIPAQAVIKGDARVLAIAAASIVAKVARDRLMVALDESVPGFGFASHKGYGTSAHAKALKRHGPCDHHRKSFRPIRAYFE